MRCAYSRACTRPTLTDSCVALSAPRMMYNPQAPTHPSPLTTKSGYPLGLEDECRRPPPLRKALSTSHAPRSLRRHPSITLGSAIPTPPPPPPPPPPLPLYCSHSLPSLSSPPHPSLTRRSHRATPLRSLPPTGQLKLPPSLPPSR